MSSRHIRRLQGNQDDLLMSFADTHSSDDDDDDDDDDVASSSVLNAFALLDGDDDDTDDDDEVPDDTQDNGHTADDAQGEEEAHVELDEASTTLSGKAAESLTQPSGHASKKSKKKNRNKKGPKGKGKGKAKNTKDNDMELLEAAIAENKQALLEAGEITSVETLEHNETMKSLFACDAGGFDVQVEMKAVFGLSAEEAEVASGASSGRALQAASQRANAVHRKRLRGAQRPLLFGSPKHDWPAMTQGLSMEEGDSVDGCTEFRFVYSEEYEMVQAEYMRCVASGQPQTLMHLAQVYPYHVDTLLQLSDYFKSTNDLANSGLMIQRALYAYECAFHSSFDLTSGTCRLSPEHEPNRSFMLAVFRHLQMASRRGLNNTALTCAKALLGLCPDLDPMGVLHCIDYYALRSSNHAFVRRFCANFDNSRIYLLPNFAFSLPMAKFVNSEAGTEDEDEEVDSSSSSSPAAEAGSASARAWGPLLDSEADADALLQQAIMLFPMAVGPLLAKINVSGSSWQQLFDHEFFRYRKQSQEAWTSQSLQHLVKIFVERNHGLWMDTTVQQWLQDQVRAVLARYDDEHDTDIDTLTKARDTLFSNQADINLFQHLMLSDFSDTIAVVPDEFLEEGGALPVPLQAHGIEQDTGPILPNPYYGNIAQMNPAVLFFGSMLPWTGVPNQANVDAYAGLTLQEQEDLMATLMAQWSQMWNGHG